MVTVLLTNGCYETCDNAIMDNSKIMLNLYKNGKNVISVNIKFVIAIIKDGEKYPNIKSLGDDDDFW